MRQYGARDGVLNAEMHKVRPADALGRGLFILLLELQYLLRRLQKLLAVLRQHERAAAHEQRRSKLLLQLRYLLAQGLLREEEVLCRG